MQSSGIVARLNNWLSSFGVLSLFITRASFDKEISTGNIKKYISERINEYHFNKYKIAKNIGSKTIIFLYDKNEDNNTSSNYRWASLIKYDNNTNITSYIFDIEDVLKSDWEIKVEVETKVEQQNRSRTLELVEQNVAPDGNGYLHALRCVFGDDTLINAFGGADPASIRGWLYSEACDADSSYRGKINSKIDEDFQDYEIYKCFIDGQLDMERVEQLITHNDYFMTYDEIDALNDEINKIKIVNDVGILTLLRDDNHDTFENIRGQILEEIRDESMASFKKFAVIITDSSNYCYLHYHDGPTIITRDDLEQLTNIKRDVAGLNENWTCVNGIKTLLSTHNTKSDLMDQNIESPRELVEQNVAADGDCYLHALRCVFGDDTLKNAFGAPDPDSIRRWLYNELIDDSSEYMKYIKNLIQIADETDETMNIYNTCYNKIEKTLDMKKVLNMLKDNNYYMSHCEIYALNSEITKYNPTRVGILNPTWGRGQDHTSHDLTVRIVNDMNNTKHDGIHNFAVIVLDDDHYRYLRYDDGTTIISRSDLEILPDIRRVGDGQNVTCENGIMTSIDSDELSLDYIETWKLEKELAGIKPSEDEIKKVEEGHRIAKEYHEKKENAKELAWKDVIPHPGIFLNL